MCVYTDKPTAYIVYNLVQTYKTNNSGLHNANIYVVQFHVLFSSFLRQSV